MVQESNFILGLFKGFKFGLQVKQFRNNLFRAYKKALISMSTLALSM